MAKGFYNSKSYRKNALPWGFIDENGNPVGAVVGRMSREVKSAIENTFQNHYLTGKYGNIKLYDKVEHEAEFLDSIFATAEVKPEIYYLDKETYCATFYASYIDRAAVKTQVSVGAPVGFQDAAGEATARDEYGNDLKIITARKNDLAVSYNTGYSLKTKYMQNEETVYSGKVPVLTSNTSWEGGQALFVLVNATNNPYMNGQTAASAYRAFNGVIQNNLLNNEDDTLAFNPVSGNTDVIIAFKFNEATEINSVIANFCYSQGGVKIPQQYRVVISDNGTDWTPITDYASTINNTYEYIINLPSSVNATYIGVECYSNTYIGINNIQFGPYAETLVTKDYFKAGTESTVVQPNIEKVAGTTWVDEFIPNAVSADSWLIDLGQLANAEELIKLGYYGTSYFGDIWSNTNGTTFVNTYKDYYMFNSFKSKKESDRINYGSGITVNDADVEHVKQYGLFAETSTAGFKDISNWNNYYFVVKTKVPYLDDDGLVIPETIRKHEQYWYFSVSSLLHQVGFDSEGVGFSGYLTLSGAPGCTGQVDGSAIKIENSDGNVCTAFFPFPWSIIKTKYFNGNINGSNVNSKLVVPSSYNNIPSWFSGNSSGKTRIAAQRGCCIISPNPETFISFLYWGLGMKATLSELDYNSTPFEYWSQPAKPNPYDTGPGEGESGSGGQTPEGPGGGECTGAGNWSNDDVGTGYDSTFTEGVGNTYCMTWENVRKLREHLTDPSLWESIQRLVLSNTEATIKMTKYPMRFNTMLGNVNESVVEVNNVLLGTTTEAENSVTAKLLPNGIKTKWLIGQIDIDLKYMSFVDFKQTSYNLYIPFYGFIPLNAEDVAGRRLKLYINISYGKGTATAIIYTSNNIAYDNDFSGIEDDGMHPLLTIPINFGEDLALSSNGNLMGEVAKIKGAFSTGITMGLNTMITPKESPAGTVPQDTNTYDNAISIVNSVMNFKGNTAIGGGNAEDLHSFSICNPVPFLIIGFPTVVKPEGYSKIYGNPVVLIDKLSNYTGYTKCENVKLYSANALDGELSELQQLLEGGIYL